MLSCSGLIEDYRHQMSLVGGDLDFKQAIPAPGVFQMQYCVYFMVVYLSLD